MRVAKSDDHDVYESYPCNILHNLYMSGDVTPVSTNQYNALAVAISLGIICLGKYERYNFQARHEEHACDSLLVSSV